MSDVLSKIKELKDIDASVQIRGNNEKTGYMVEAVLVQFRVQEDEALPAKILKKVNAFAEAKGLDDAQDAALVRAGKLLGLGE